MTSAAILNGGHARRLGGRNKGLLLVGGRTILDLQLAVLRPLSTDIMIVGDRDPDIAQPDIRVVRDRHHGLGPLGGLEAALGAARGDSLIVLASDMPGVTHELVARLLHRLPGHQAVVPRTHSGYHPLCAAYRRDILPAVERRLAESLLDVRGLLQELVVAELGETDLDDLGDPARLLANVNTPADHAEFDARWADRAHGR